MLYVVNYVSSAIACALTLTALGWPLTVAEGALVCAIGALVAVAVLRGIGPARMAGWHRRRARSLFERSASVSSIWGPLAWGFWTVLLAAEIAHTFCAEALSS